MSAAHSTESSAPEIPGWPGYRATTGGSILYFRNGRWRPLRTCVQDVYVQAKLRRNGKRSTLHVHKLILLAHVGPCPDGMVCRHLDGNPRNNRLSNLKWGTPLENAADTIRHGRTPRGSQIRAAKLREGEVAQIRWYVANRGYTPKMVATCWHISEAQASQICSGKAWKHVNWVESPRDRQAARAEGHGLNLIR
jgi:hypothetical protein